MAWTRSSIVAALCLATTAAAAPAAAQFGAGLQSATKNYGLAQLAAEAKRAMPDSLIPVVIEHLLTGISLATDPTASIEGVYPGSLAASAIEQLITRHGRDIVRMSYRERRVFVGGVYADPSILPEDRVPPPPDAAGNLCSALVLGSEFRFCIALVRRIQRCSAVRDLSQREINNCNTDLTRFYELMEYEGTSALVREAGAVAGRELRKLPAATGGFGASAASDIAGEGFIRCPQTQYPLMREDRSNPNAFAFAPKIAYVAGKIHDRTEGLMPVKRAECKYRNDAGRIATVTVQWNARPGRTLDPSEMEICSNAGWNSLGPWLSEHQFSHNDRSIYVSIKRLLEGNNRVSDMFNQSERDAIARHMMRQAEPNAFPCHRPWEK